MIDLKISDWPDMIPYLKRFLKFYFESYNLKIQIIQFPEVL